MSETIKIREARPVDSRVGTRGGDYLMPVSFAKDSKEFVLAVQKLYRENHWSQKELWFELTRAGYDVSRARIAKMVRCDPLNIDRVNLESLGKVKPEQLTLKAKKVKRAR